MQARYVYDAWGNHKIFNAQGIDISTNSSYNDHVGRINPFRYKGYFYDQYTGLYYLESRYYDPTVRRFINADSVAYIDPNTFGGLNLYAYCGNNPIMYVDPTGHDWLHWAIAIGVIAILAIATCFSAGGAAAGVWAIMAATSGNVVAGALTTTLAFATVGAATTLAASAVVAGIGAVEEWATGASFTDGLMSISDYGETALNMTLKNSVLGAYAGYMSFKEQIGDDSQLGFMDSNARAKQRYAYWKSRGEASNGRQISHIYGTFGNNRNYFETPFYPEHKAFHAIYGYKTAGGPFHRFNPNYNNWWMVLESLLGIM